MVRRFGVRLSFIYIGEDEFWERAASISVLFVSRRHNLTMKGRLSGVWAAGFFPKRWAVLISFGGISTFRVFLTSSRTTLLEISPELTSGRLVPEIMTVSRLS